MSDERRKAPDPDFEGQERRDEPHDYEARQRDWELRRDKLLFTLGAVVFLVGFGFGVATDLKNPEFVGTVLTLDVGILASPTALRWDAERRRRRNGGNGA